MDFVEVTLICLGLSTGLGRGSIIIASSVHNTRVKRLYRDIYSGVLSFFEKAFCELEDSGHLDPLKEVHIFALHYVYMPHINRCLKKLHNGRTIPCLQRMA